MKNHANALILFARAPRLGQVKTRLHPHLDHETILNLYTRFLDDSIDKVCAVGNADRFIGTYSPEQMGYFEEVASRREITVFAQEGKDLGERMRDALARRFEEKYEKAVIIGSDSPSLPAHYIEMAFQSDKDIVLGPSADGGYYLVGMSRKRVEIFDGVSWGSEKVLAETLERVKTTGATLELLPLWYDVDRLEDLRFLKTHLMLLAHCGINHCKSTREFLARLEL